MTKVGGFSADLSSGAGLPDLIKGVVRKRTRNATLSEDLLAVWQSLQVIEPTSGEWVLPAPERGGDRHHKAMWHLVAGGALQPDLSPRAGLAHLRQAEVHFRSLSMRDMCQAVRVEAALHMREAGFSALALSSLDSPAALEVDHFAASVHAARALCLLDLGRIEPAATAAHAARRAIAESRRGVSLRAQWYLELASVQLRVVAAAAGRRFECHLTEPLLARDRLNAAEFARLLDSLGATSPHRPGFSGTSAGRESTALEGLLQAAEWSGGVDRGSALARLAADFALRPRGVGAQAWLWLGTTQLLAGHPKSALACLQQAISAATAVGAARVQRGAQIELVHAYEQAGQSAEALAAHKELRRLEAVLRERSAPTDWSQPDPAAWSGPDPASIQNMHLRRAIALMNQEPGRLTVELLAQGCGVSRRTLEKAFRSELGQSVAECLRGRRLAMVRAKLLRGSDSIKRIALETGYPSASALCHDFKRATGVTPARYRADATMGGETD